VDGKGLEGTSSFAANVDVGVDEQLNEYLCTLVTARIEYKKPHNDLHSSTCCNLNLVARMNAQVLQRAARI
jgi:hypothetical protein